MSATGMEWLSRDALLDGLPARKAALLLFAIEGRTAQLVASDQRDAAPYLPPALVEEREKSFMAAVAAGRDLPAAPTIQCIERYAAQWAPLVPESAGIRAVVAHMLGEKYVFTQRDTPQLQAALGLGTPAVQEAYTRSYAQALDTIYAPQRDWRQGLQWAWNGLMGLLERLPPFWLAFFLTMPGAIGLLVMPIALAGLGPVWGLVVLVSVGLLNMLTVIGFAEACTRSNTIRFGLGYIGQIAQEYLGNIGGLLAAVVLALNRFVLLIVLYLSVGDALAGGASLPAEVWMAGLLAILLYFLWRGSFNATVSSTLLIVVVTVLLTLLIPLLVLPHVRMENLLAAARPFAADGFTWAALGPVLGVLLTAFIAHVLVPAYAPVVLRRDPSGRALIHGSAAAIAASIVIAALWLLTVQGAVAPDILRDAPGTVITPLAELIGPWIHLVGALLVVLNLGLISIQVALGLYYLVQERLGPVRTGGPSRRTRFLLAGSPVLAAFLVAEWLAINNITSFANLLGIVGALTLPVLAGALPLLVLLATRHKGDFTPAVVYRWLGNRFVVGVIYAIFIGSIFLHGLLIWEDWPLRILALVAGVLIVAATTVMLRRGILEPRLVLGLHHDQSLHGSSAWLVTFDGEPLATPLEFRNQDGEQAVTGAGSGPLPRFDGLCAVRMAVPAVPWQELKVWARRTTPEIVVVSIPGSLHVRGEGGETAYDTEAAGGQVLITQGAGVQELEFEPAPAGVRQELLGGSA